MGSVYSNLEDKSKLNVEGKERKIGEIEIRKGGSDLRKKRLDFLFLITELTNCDLCFS